MPVCMPLRLGIGFSDGSGLLCELCGEINLGKGCLFEFFNSLEKNKKEIGSLN